MPSVAHLPAALVLACELGPVDLPLAAVACVVCRAAGPFYDTEKGAAASVRFLMENGEPTARLAWLMSDGSITMNSDVPRVVPGKRRVAA